MGWISCRNLVSLKETRDDIFWVVMLVFFFSWNFISFFVRIVSVLVEETKGFVGTWSARSRYVDFWDYLCTRRGIAKYQFAMWNLWLNFLIITSKPWLLTVLYLYANAEEIYGIVIDGLNLNFFLIFCHRMWLAWRQNMGLCE